MDKVFEFTIVSGQRAKSIIPGRIDNNEYVFKAERPYELNKVVVDESEEPQVDAHIIMTVNNRDVGGDLPIKQLVRNKATARLIIPAFVDQGSTVIVNLVLQKDVHALTHNQKVILHFDEV
jgi:hypothetical protein